MKEYITLDHSSEAQLNATICEAAKKGFHLFTFLCTPHSNGEFYFVAVMERDLPEPPTSAHLTKEDYETLKSAHEWLVHLGSRGAITKGEVTRETWGDYIETRAAIATLRDKAGRL